MPERAQGPQNVIRFGPFEADLHTRELRKHGIRVRLRGQAFQILQMLLERPGVLVTREELQKTLWPANTFIDFEHGVNSAVNDLREALGDAANEQRLVETLPRRGYRFLGTIERPDPGPPKQPDAETSSSSRWLKFTAWTVAGSLCALAVAFLHLRSRPSTETRSFKPVPFTALPGVETTPSFSPDGSRIAFAWNGDPASGGQGFDLYVKAIGSETLLRLTKHPSEFISPAWSPDGTQIAFHRLSGADSGVYVVPALGGPERKLRATRIPFGIGIPISWSPDGKWIAYNDFLTGAEDPRIFLLSTDTLEGRQIPHAPECIAESLPAFSHNGKLMAYGCMHSWEEFAIYSVAPSGGSPKLIATHPNLPLGIAWSMDDEKLLFSEESRVSEITLADGSIRELPLAQSGVFPTISSKDGKLAYSVSFDNINIWRKDLLHPDSPAVKLLSSTRQQANAQYSPNGKHITFGSTRAGNYDVWISDADGSNLVQVSNLNQETWAPRWSYDGEKVVFSARAFHRDETYVADISERVPRKLVTNIPTMNMPSWSHDGKWIYFVGVGGKIYRCPATGGDAVPLSAQSGITPLESSDGRTVYFATRPSKPILKEISVDQPGTESPLEGMPRLLGAYVWTVVPGGIYFVAADAPRSLQYFDFATRKSHKIFEVDKDFDDGLSVSPDGRWILYSQVDEKNRDIMLVDHFY